MPRKNPHPVTINVLDRRHRDDILEAAVDGLDLHALCKHEWAPPLVHNRLWVESVIPAGGRGWSCVRGDSDFFIHSRPKAKSERQEGVREDVKFGLFFPAGLSFVEA